jgi:CRP-like cAMP-binding protein
LPPPSSLLDFPPGQSIYTAEEPAYGVFLIDRGIVEVAKPGYDGSDLLLDLYIPGEIFGETALVNRWRRDESARALTSTSVRFWTVAEISAAVSDSPSLALALSKMLIGRTRTLRDRLASMAGDDEPRRVARALLRFAARIGRPSTNGWSVLPALTDDILSRYTRATAAAVARDMRLLQDHGCTRNSRHRSLPTATGGSSTSRSRPRGCWGHPGAARRRSRSTRRASPGS